jgi:hypothetical protein
MKPKQQKSDPRIEQLSKVLRAHPGYRPPPELSHAAAANA